MVMVLKDLNNMLHLIVFMLVLLLTKSQENYSGTPANATENDPISGLASPTDSTEVSGLVLGCIEDAFATQRMYSFCNKF